RRPSVRYQKRVIEHDSAPGAGLGRGLAARVLGMTGQGGVEPIGLDAGILRDVLHSLALSLLAQQECGTARGRRRFARGGHALAERALLVEAETHAPLLAIADASQHVPHALERAPDVVDGSLVA